MFAYPELIKFLYKNPNVLLLNYTYKINKFKIPFLYIIGVSNNRHNFKLTYYFLPSKIEANYSFVIQQLYLLYYHYNLKPKVIIIDKE